jgi:hypothetical protein
MIERLWRARKHHVWIDARLAQSSDARVELSFFYDGSVVFAMACASRAVAIAEADRKLRELERAGWNTHW